MTELRVFGPPGTGKTTYLAAQVSRAAQKYGADRVLVSSFTRAAAAEIGSRGLPIPPQMCATLHAHAYRSLGRPEVAEKHIKEWNAGATDARHVLTVSGVDVDDAAEANYSSDADEIAARYQTYRALLRPRDLWEADVRYFAEKWESWKAENEYIDFTDMIEMALNDIEEAPGEPLIGFIDEAQDLTPLELALVRKWGSHMEYLVMAGDDDQSIYAFKGATPDAFLDPPLPASQKRVLAQSYRIPLAVHTFAEDWVLRLSRREPKMYKPRDYEGSFRRLTDASEYGNKRADFEHPDLLLDDAERYLEAGQTVMYLGSCAYMLDELVQEMRARGLTFHNPYRRKNGRWNPLHPARGVSAGHRLAAWMKLPSEWTPHDVKTWSFHMSKPKVFVRGSGEKMLDGIGQQYHPMPQEYYSRVFTPEFINGFASVDDPVDHFSDLLLESKRGVYTYPLTILRKHGIEMVLKAPQIIIGTIHSVKGGEADAVYLMPDLSRPGYSEYIGGGRDSTIRQMYVGMTRAKEALILTGAVSPLCVQELR